MRKLVQTTISICCGKLGCLLLVMTTLSAFCFSPYARADQDNNIKKVLLLNSYNYGYKWSDLETEGVFAGFKEFGTAAELHIEYLDTKRVFDAQHLDNIYRLYKHKFSKNRFDLIISLDNDALEFLKKYRNELFPGAPVVFCGINDFSYEMLKDQKNITGVIETIDYKKTIEVALRLVQRAYNVVIVSDNTVTGRLHEKNIREAEPAFKDRAAFSYLSLANMTMRELKSRLSLLSPNSVVILIAHFKDKTGQTFPLQESLSMLAKASSAPCFVVTEDRVAYGVVGGMVVSGSFQGRTAAEAGIRILKGEAASDIPVIIEGPNKYLFDYTALAHWNISLDRLPSDSIVKNRPVSYYHANKKLIWYVSLIFFGLCIFLVVLLSNIIKRIKLEKMLRSNEERLKAILETVPDGIVVLDNEGKITFANAAAEEILGLSLDNITKRTYNDPKWRISAMDGSPVNEDDLPFARVKKSGKPVFNAEHSIQHPDGNNVYLSINAAPLFRAKGDFSGVIASMSDITARVQTQKALAESQNRFNMFMKYLPGYAYIKDMSGRYIYVNNRFSTAMKTQADQIIGKLNNEVWTDINSKQFSSNDNAVLEKGHSLNFEETLTIDGEDRVFVSYKFPMPSEDGSLLLGGISIDITEQKKLEAQLQHAQKMEAVGTLAGGVAHDFNNILTAIIGYAHLCLMKISEDSQIRKNIEQIIEAGQKAATLTQRLLAFSRKQVVNLAPVDLNDIAKRFEQLFQRLLREDIEFIMQLSNSPLPVLVDAIQIEQAIMNLATNARDAMPHGGRLELSTSQVELNAAQAADLGLTSGGRYAVISVRDTGKGIDESIRSKIFEPFFTTKDVGKGTGLGLSMVYGTVKKHDGCIYLETEPGKGSAFRIYLPLIKTSSNPAKPELSRLQAPAAAGGSEVILIAEDNDAIRELAVEVLAQNGYRVIESIDGQDAIDRFQENSKIIDLAIIDGIMPIKNGWEVYQAIHAINPGIKVIFISGYSEDIFDSDRIKASGALYLKKPLRLEDLLLAVRQELNKKKSE